MPGRDLRRPAAPTGRSATAAAHRARRRVRRLRGVVLLGAATALLAFWLNGALTGGPQQHPGGKAAQHPAPGDGAAAAGDAGDAGDAAADRSDRSRRAEDAPPGLGRAFGARIPANSRQVVLVSGRSTDSADSTLTIWSRNSRDQWETLAKWPAHNGYSGWTNRHTQGDLRSPIGLYTLSDAGGRRPDPGSGLPYHRDSRFDAEGTGFAGERLDGAFDYVIAIDYNRVTGTSPLDPRRPEGNSKGGGIWLHVDHGGATHGCVTVSEDHMVELLRTLDPAAHPVIVIADAVTLAE